MSASDTDALQIQFRFFARHARATWERRYFSTMKTFFSVMFAVTVSTGTVRAEGPIHKAADVAEDTPETAKNVGHSVVKGTKKAVNTVVDALTPDPDARRVDV